MNGLYLKFYVNEYRAHPHHNNQMIYEWLLEQANKLGIHGGSAFKAIAGFGYLDSLHKNQLCGMGNDVPVEVVFLVSKEEAEQFLEIIKNEGLTLLYIKHPVEYNVINGGVG